MIVSVCVFLHPMLFKGISIIDFLNNNNQIVRNVLLTICCNCSQLFPVYWRMLLFINNEAEFDSYS